MEKSTSPAHVLDNTEAMKTNPPRGLWCRKAVVTECLVCSSVFAFTEVVPSACPVCERFRARRRQIPSSTTPNNNQEEN